MSTPSVSVIIPTYEPKTLSQTLESVFNQTYSDFEVIVVDDGSKCPIDSVLQSFPQVRVIRQTNAGVSVARNRGVLESKSEFIAFLDHDDIWLPEKLQKQVSALTSLPEAGFCFSDLQIFRDATIFPVSDGSSPSVLDMSQNGRSIRSSLHESILFFRSRLCVPSTLMYRRTLLSKAGLMDPSLPYTGDYDMLVKLGSMVPFVHLQECLVLYRVHDENFSKQYEVCQKELRELSRRYQRLARLANDRDLERDCGGLFRLDARIYSAYAIDRSRRSFREKQVLEGLTHLLKALRFDAPFVAQGLALAAKNRLCVQKEAVSE